MKLTDLSLKQLERLYAKAYDRMSAGDGYQPFGYDWPTLRIAKPGWFNTLRAINDACVAKRTELARRKFRVEANAFGNAYNVEKRAGATFVPVIQWLSVEVALAWLARLERAGLNA